MRKCTSILSGKLAFLFLGALLPLFWGMTPDQASQQNASAHLACVADFYRSDSSGCSPLTVTFSDNSQGTISTYNWSFNGGSPGSATGAGPHTVTYSSAGFYDAILNIVCRDGNDSVTKRVWVRDCECVADFSADQTSGCAPMTVTFTDNSSYASSWYWTFTGGSPSSATGAGPHQITYASAGVYPVSLTIHCGDTGSDTETKTQYITVDDCECEADFYGDPNGLCAPVRVVFVDQSTNAQEWYWTFTGGSPATATGQGPHAVVYSNPGAYSPKLEIVCANDQTSSKTRKEYVEVSDCNLDWGDAPSPYPTQSADNGACHTIKNDIYLGQSVDSEPDGMPGSDADGDDKDVTPDDEDGVLFTAVLLPGKTATVTVMASAAAVCNAWMDFNADGDWADADEHIINNFPTVSGLNQFSFWVPADAKSGATYARFRISSARGLSYSGSAEDGEVEDYQIIIGENGPLPDATMVLVDICLEADVRLPDGSQDHVDIIGSLYTKVNIASAGIASDPDGNGRDQVQATVVLGIFSYKTTSSPDIIYIYLDPNRPSPGILEETTNLTPGILDVPSFTTAGSAELQFDFYFSFVYQSIYYYASQPLFMKATITSFPPAGAIELTAPITAPITTVDENGQPAAFTVTALQPCGGAAQSQYDFGDAPASYQGAAPFHLCTDAEVLLGKVVDGEASALTDANAQGDDMDNQDDEDGITFLTPLIPGQKADLEVDLSKAKQELALAGFIDFDGNGQWDSATEMIVKNTPLPYGAVYGISFDVPANAKPGETFARFYVIATGPVPADGCHLGEVEDYKVIIGGDSPQPDLKLMGYDVCMELDLQLPGGAMEHLTLNGTAIANATITSTGTAADDNGNGRDQVNTKLLTLTLNTVATSMGPLTISLNPAIVSSGDVEELVNATPGILDVRPFTATGTAECAYDVYFQIHIQTNTYFTTQPVKMKSFIALLPPVSANLDPQPGLISIDIVDTKGLPTGLSLRAIAPCAPTQKEFDFGDAPAPYPTLKAQNGAYCLIDKNVTLGSLVDGESDGLPNAGAAGDDNDHLDDEDGFEFLSPAVPGQICNIQSVLGNLDAYQSMNVHWWFDFNGDGDWNDSYEYYKVNLHNPTPVSLTSVPLPLNYPIPANAKPGVTYARCLVTTDDSYSSSNGTGYAGTGEVEDISFTIAASTTIHLGDRVWEDNDHNGIQDFGEFGLAGVTVELYANNVLSTTTTTDAFGLYQFNNLSAGQYLLKFILPPGFVFSQKDQGTDDQLDSDADPTSGMTDVFSLSLNTINLHWDAGMYRGGEELYDFGDAPSPYPTLHAQGGAYALIDPDIYFGKSIDGENDGQPHSTAQGDDNTGIDDEDGLTIYTPLVPGQYFHLAVTITTDESVWSTVWIDYDGNGNWELGEALAASNLMNCNQYALHSTGTMPATAKPGITNIRCLLATDEKSYPSANGYQGKGEVEDYQITIAASAPTFLGDFVWHDANHNGIQESGENGIAMATVNLYQSSGSLAGSATTDGSGYYAFNHVAAGDYYLEFVLPSGWTFSPLDQGGDDLRDSDVDPAKGTTAVFTLTANTINIQWDAGMYRAESTGGIDYGDAPDNDKTPRYPTLASHNGASHTIVKGFHLGSGIDGENDGQPETHALGDDQAGMDDEDGVHFYGPLVIGYCTPAEVSASQPGYINVWVDGNGDGDWSDAGEHVWTDFHITSSVHTLCINTPANGQKGVTFARFRFSSAPGLSFDGAAQDGEVEDYEIEILDEMPEYDFGDAPDPAYPTLHVHGGAYHVITSGIFLGAGVDAEPDGQPHGHAEGDDLNGDDEDGILFPAPWVPGHMAELLVNPSIAGYLNAWADFNGDGDWSDADEQICSDQAVSPPFTLLAISVPPDAKQGTIFVRFRFSTWKSIPVTGMARDGEVEDYAVHIGELGRPLNKWSQPPLKNKKSEHPGYFWGWDEFSVYRLRVLADDWFCNDPRPVTSIHWWGSYIGWGEKEPPPNAPSGFHIGIWTDRPASGLRPWSHPDQLVWEKTIERAALNERIVGTDFFPLVMQKPDSCYRYDLILPTHEWFHQEKDSTVYWLSVAAIYEQMPDQYAWGWKTRRHFFNDDAVLIEQPKEISLGSTFAEGRPVGELWDAAFELGTIEDHSEFDFGDAPAFYPTLVEDNGALHFIRKGIHLGRGIDPEMNGQPEEKALGDDHNDLSDEDGVFFITPLRTGEVARIEVIASAKGFLSAWIDFQGNGFWDEPEDRIIFNRQLLPGVNRLEFMMPPVAVPVTFARFRFSTVNPRSYGGLAFDGEVEDYVVNIGLNAIDQKEKLMPSRFELQQNYPNPFNPATVIAYSVPKAAKVRITVYNISGQQVAMLVDAHHPAGNYQIVWPALDTAGRILPSGIYLYRMEAGEFTAMKKLLFLK